MACGLAHAWRRTPPFSLSLSVNKPASDGVPACRLLETTTNVAIETLRHELEGSKKEVLFRTLSLSAPCSDMRSPCWGRNKIARLLGLSRVAILACCLTSRFFLCFPRHPLHRCMTWCRLALCLLYAGLTRLALCHVLLDAIPCSRIKWTKETDLRLLHAGHHMVAFAHGAKRSQMEVGTDARPLSLSYVSYDKE